MRPRVFANEVSRAIACAGSLFLAACGGGGGGGNGGGNPPPSVPLVYAGATTPAAITPTNAAGLTANVIGSGVAAVAGGRVAGVSAQGESAPQSAEPAGVTGLTRRLKPALRADALASRHGSARAGVIPIDETDPCDSGSIRFSGTLADNGTGTLAVSYNACRTGTDTINGSATLEVQTFNPLGIITDGLFNFPRLNFSGPGVSADLSGTERIHVDIGSNTETLTQNFVTQDTNTRVMTKTENMVTVNVYDNVVTPSTFTESISGRVFDSVQGYVDVATATPLAFASASQSFPNSGRLLLTGAANARIRVTALSANAARLELDANGDTVFELAAMLAWSELGGPAGADLRDDDNDGLHNSWETAHGLDPHNAADAALDRDGDGATNRAEYLGGTDPGSAGSVPSGVFGPQTLAAGVAVANSDKLNPGRHALASDGSNFLLVSRQQVNIPNAFATSKWTARRVLAAGGAEAPFDLQAPNQDPGGDAAVAFDGANYLAVMTVLGDLKAQRISAAGALLDAAPGLTISPAAWNPAIAFGRGLYLVVYVKTTSRANLWGVIVQPSGAVGAEFAIHTGTGIQATPSVAFDGTNFLVAWEHHDADGLPETADIVGARVAPSGAVLASAFPIASAAEAQNYPQAACDGVNCLVVWTDRRNYPGQSYNFDPPPGDMFGTRIAADNTLLDGTGGRAIATGITANAGNPGLAYDGSEYIVAWSRGAFVNNPGGPTGIYSARMRRDGSVLLGTPGTGVPVSGPPENAARFFYVALAAGTGFTLATWLNGRERGGSTKSIDGALMYPLAP